MRARRWFYREGPCREGCPWTHAPQREITSQYEAIDPGHRDLQKGHIQVTNEEILRGLAEIVNEVAGVETSEITPEKSFVDELDIDSLSMVEIAVQVEDRFGVKVPDDVLANLKTVGDAVDYVAKTT
jgi:acyl carrier protein